MATEVKPTQRAYTLRLKGKDPGDNNWSDALWKTHEAVNIGAKVFGDWLLTLRGGLDYKLAYTPVITKKEIRKPTANEQKSRRILLALSWLSVESKFGAPDEFVVSSGKEKSTTRNKEVLSALREILKRRGLKQEEIERWVKDCELSLSANIRSDAVWVNRSKAFDKAILDIEDKCTREEIWDFLERFLGTPDIYFAPVKISDDNTSEYKTEERPKDLVIQAGQWLSSRFGRGKGVDFRRVSEVYQKIQEWTDEAPIGITWNEAISNITEYLSEYSPASNDLVGLLKLISGGRDRSTNIYLKSVDKEQIITCGDLEKLKDKASTDRAKCISKIGSKGHRPYSDFLLNKVEASCGFTYVNDNGGDRHAEYSVMLDHAARRVSLAHTWIKRAEANRRQFEQDAEKKNDVPLRIRNWLDNFCKDRAEASGALEAYYIRRRAAEGWKEVVSAWSTSSCVTFEDRIQAVRTLQGDREIEKFGDINLFEALAHDNAKHVWHEDGDLSKLPDPQPLINYVLASEAEFKKQRFKVPAYRHPDPLLHPVFCDYGKSRWDIEYAVHNNEHESRLNELRMSLWNGQTIEKVQLFWQSKRLRNDLFNTKKAPNGHISEVARADRLGRAAAGVNSSDAVKAAGLFEQERWNGRLQAPRRQLEEIAAVRDNESLSKALRESRVSTMSKHIRWFITFSPKLEPRGPWCDFAKTHDLKIDPRYWPYADENKGRKGQARLVLPRLPGLRILSVDLGHRYAAACTVWETMSSRQINNICRDSNHSLPQESDMFLHIKQDVKKLINSKDKRVIETKIIRRIGPDKLPNGKIHPAPWAILDRQFLIKLQGEEKDARIASNEEIWAVHQMETQLGRATPLIDRLVNAGWGGNENQGQMKRLDELRKMGWQGENDKNRKAGADEDYIPRIHLAVSVDELMFSAVRTMRVAIKRHGDLSRIAFAMIGDYKIQPGEKKYYFKKEAEASEGDSVETRHQKHVEFVLNALLLWYDLGFSRGWSDKEIERLWMENICTLPGYKKLEDGKDDIARDVRSRKRKDNREKLQLVAEKLVENENLRIFLNEELKTQWETEDKEFIKQLRWLKDWIFPRGIRAKDKSIRNIGGLSLTRIATMTDFRRRVQVAFFSRLKPDGTKADITEHFGQKALDDLEQLREQRVKQIASRIVEAALGIGRTQKSFGPKDVKRLCDSIDKPCHAVIIENLTHYRPIETRTRRENRQLMQWSSSRIRDYLSEGCELNGLHLREVSPGFTSRQDSRTGAPGIRCEDVLIREFMMSFEWRNQVAKAEKKKAEGKGDSRDRFLCDLNDKWKDRPKEWAKKTIRLPVRGGDLFVSSDTQSPAAKGLQADLNAAANIGLKAITDPDWPGMWWYVPCDPSSFKPIADKTKGSAVINLDLPLTQMPTDSKTLINKRKNKKKTMDIRLWRDISDRPVSAAADNWRDYTSYWNGVQKTVVEILREDEKLSIDDK